MDSRQDFLDPPSVLRESLRQVGVKEGVHSIVGVSITDGFLAAP